MTVEKDAQQAVRPITWYTRALGGVDFHAVFVCGVHEQEYRKAADLLRVSLTEARNHQGQGCDWCAHVEADSEASSGG